MNIRTFLPLLLAFSFVMVSAGNGSAQSDPVLYPYDVQLALDLTSISHDLNEQTITPDTIRGTMKDASGLGASNITINITSAMQWVISTKINGDLVHDGSMMSLGSGQSFPVEIVIFPYAERPDTEDYCLKLSLSPTYVLNHQCVTLTLTSTKAAVSTDLPIPNITVVPNPASNYVLMRGLSDMQAGYRYEIYSITGVEVLRGMLPSDARISTQEIPSGAYRLLLIDGNRTVVNTAFTVVH
ncbi:MAG: T9SS type A sorting domain-containing protein [Bacteroidota bacterium]|nr:T9SS type A sorting domain-containing protein [Bacteroidota bacterium]MDP4230365.1 T9SS type A sorting domain-containing protein [Bacteroidota bacterium]MDP4236469.1 T9SS type A sorting domain-containing protein [Bacteroidota bacterium]